MATTEARSGFRLPWSPSVDDAAVSDEHKDDGPSMAADDAPGTEGVTSAPGPSQPAAPGGRKPSKFLADLTKAMQVAAEAAREATLGQFEADAKAFVESLRGRSANEAADLRKRADDDIAEIREWSKAEIARIREETEAKISGRKGRLESEIEEHAARIEREVERVQTRVAEFEARMDAFFERLRSEEDPTRFASMAESLPEPPTFDAIVATADVEDAPAAEADPSVEVDEVAPADDDRLADEGEPESPNGHVDLEADAAADQAGADDAAGDEGGADPRLAAFGFSPDFAAAEAEALAAADTAPDAEGDEVPALAEDALAARLAGFMPAVEANSPSAARTTDIFVVGLVSVAAIAGFKRQLGRLGGVQSVGVSSGPDGEFVFTVTHAEDAAIRDAVTTIPGFGVRVTASDEGTVRVTAHDPESET